MRLYHIYTALSSIGCTFLHSCVQHWGVCWSSRALVCRGFVRTFSRVHDLHVLRAQVREIFGEHRPFLFAQLQKLIRQVRFTCSDYVCMLVCENILFVVRVCERKYAYAISYFCVFMCNLCSQCMDGWFACGVLHNEDVHLQNSYLRECLYAMHAYMWRATWQAEDQPLICKCLCVCKLYGFLTRCSERGFSKTCPILRTHIHTHTYTYMLTYIHA